MYLPLFGGRKLEVQFLEKTEIVWKRKELGLLIQKLFEGR
jgi:hypothetical protein